MILTCPECATSYFVDDGKIPPDGRTVRCANCGARWLAKVEPDLQLVAAGDEGAVARESPPPRDEPPKAVSDLPGEDLPKVFRAKADTERKVRQAAVVGVGWAAAAAVLAILAALAIVFRADVVRVWPRSAAAYATIGMPVNSLGLVLEAVKAEPALQGGRAALSISGQIRNIEDRPLVAPPLKISLLNKAGMPVATQIARAADPRIPPGETRHFAIDMFDPPSSAHDLEVTFAPEKKAGAGAAPKASARAADARHAAPAADAPEGLRAAAPPPVDARPLPTSSPYALEHP
ncbi:DUF3426 domain-containing protein [Phenylobacterium sp.]|uniref:DUF3426 domain-containing protein n=1 Tax=Phenylobacterium sp. TaxID=1871053 RepID=UPI002F3F6B05